MCTVQVSVNRLQKLTERGDVKTSVDLSPDHRLVEAVCSLGSSSHTVGAEIIGRAPPDQWWTFRSSDLPASDMTPDQYLLPDAKDAACVQTNNFKTDSPGS